MPKGILILFSSFSLYSLFVGFLRLRVSLVDNEWTYKVTLTQDNLFTFINLCTNVMLALFLTIIIFKIKYNGILDNNKEV